MVRIMQCGTLAINCHRLLKVRVTRGRMKLGENQVWMGQPSCAIVCLDSGEYYCRYLFLMDGDN